MPRKPVTRNAASPARSSSPFSSGAWRTRHRPVQVPLTDLPEDLARAAAGDASAVAFRTARGDFGLVSRCDWPVVAQWGFGHDHRGYLIAGGSPLHERLIRPLTGFNAHHRNSLKADNRRRNLQVLRHAVHRALHAREARGLRTGLERLGVRWMGRWGRDGATYVGCFGSWEIAACVRDDALRHEAKGAMSVFDGTILDRDVSDLFAAQAGKAMGFTFVARGDGEVRHLSGIERAKVVDAVMAERLREGGILLIWSGNRNQWRRVPLTGLLWVTVSGHAIRVLHMREGLTCRI